MTVQVSEGVGGTSTQTLNVTVTFATIETPLFVGVDSTSSADVLAESAGGEPARPEASPPPSSSSNSQGSTLELVEDKEDTARQNANNLPAPRVPVRSTPIRQGSAEAKVVLATIPPIHPMDAEPVLAITETGEALVLPETVSVSILVASGVTAQQTQGELIPPANSREQFHRIAKEQLSESPLVEEAAVITVGTLASGYLVWA